MVWKIDIEKHLCQDRSSPFDNRLQVGYLLYILHTMLLLNFILWTPLILTVNVNASHTNVICNNSELQKRWKPFFVLCSKGTFKVQL